MKTVSAPTEAALEEVRVGDTVRVVTTDGHDVVMAVETLDREALEGRVEEVQAAPEGTIQPDESLRIPLDQISTLQVRRLDGWKTAGYVGGSIATAYLLGLVLVTALVIVPL